MEIILNSTLNPENIRSTNINFITTQLPYQNGKIGDCGELVEKSKDFSYFHRNYLEYLTMCWSSHYGAVISPTILWNIILNEIASEIKNDSEKYRVLFTKTTEEKQKIVINQRAEYKLDVNKMCDTIRSYVPTDIDIFIPKFSSDTEMSNLAQQTAFLDCISPYYEYAFTKCGIPKVKILGTVEDYKLFISNLSILSELFPNKDYFSRIKNHIENIIIHLENSEEQNLQSIYFDMFCIKKCGSGHNDKLSGWILDFFVDNTSRPLTEFPSLISSIEYTDETYANNPIKFSMFTGLFGCEKENNYLLPDFGYIIYKHYEKNKN